MKKFNILIGFIGLFLLSASYVQSQERYYYAFEEKIFLTEVPNKIMLSIDGRHLSETQQYLQRNAQIRQIDDTYIQKNVFILTTEISNGRALIEDLKNPVGVKSVYPMYTVEGGLEMGITNEFVVQFKENISEQQIEEMHRRFNIEVKEITELFLLLSVPINFDVLEVANAYQTSGLVNFSHPNFIAKKELQSLPIDPYFVNQYYLRNIGQTVNGRTCTYGADINIVGAWEITKGHSNIVVAVIDEGVTSDHPDLPNTRQVRLNGSNFSISPPGNNPSPSGNENHGNACAGIIAASHNNEGIAGIAPNCKIMPIRSAANSVADDAAAITFAKNNGADVISNSWGWASTNPNFSPVIVTAISDAVTTGRNGKGCVVVFAVGNTANHTGTPANNGYITFPASVTVTGVLKVGASDRNDMQANYSPTSNPSSPDNQLIDVVAPSGSFLANRDVWTIDIPSNAGSNDVVHGLLPTSGTNHLAYTGYFVGTSASCPQVAGVAALMLSANSTLTQNQVSTIIKQTARKAGSYVYQTNPAHPYGTWNSQMGYGVVNAHAAVQTACAIAVNFTNQTVIRNTTVTGCNIYVQGVNVNSFKIYPKLTLDATNETIIISDFNMQLGTELEIR